MELLECIPSHNRIGEMSVYIDASQSDFEAWVLKRDAVTKPDTAYGVVRLTSAYNQRGEYIGCYDKVARELISYKPTLILGE